MAVVEKSRQKSKKEDPQAGLKRAVRLRPVWLWEETGYIRQGLKASPLYALLFGAVALFSLAYQVPLDFRFKPEPNFTAYHLYTLSFNKPEANGDFGFSWTSDESYLRFPGVGRLPASKLELTMEVGGRPSNLPLPTVEVWIDGRKIGQAKVEPGAKVYRFDYRPEGRQLKGDLLFTLKVSDAFQVKDHNLPLGVVVREVRLQGGAENNRPVWPALPQLALLLTGLVVFYLAMIRAGWSAIGSAAWAGLLACGAALALALARLHLTPAIESLFMSLLLAYPLLVIGLRVTRYWLGSSGQKSEVGNQRLKQPFAWLGLIFVATFVVKAAGLNHPAFVTIDHWFRVHQILRFWDTPLQFWQQYFNVSTGQTVTGQDGGSAVLGQWGLAISLPYSPLFYLFAAPFGLIWPSHDPNLLAAVNLLATWLEASSVFLIFLIACEAFREVWAEQAGLITAALYGFYPLSFLLFSDGGYNSILAHWLTLLFVALLFKPQTQEPFWHNLALVLTLAAALLAHTSTLLLLGSLVITSLLLAGLAAKVQPRTSLLADLSFRKRPFGLILLTGFGLAFGLYYGWYIIPFVRDSLPAILGKLGSGNIGQDRAKLGTELLSGFWPQLWEHFRLFPFLLTLLALLSYVLRARSKPSALVQPGSSLQSSTFSPSRLIVNCFLLAWLLVFLAFVLLDLKVNLLQKHMLFVAPLLCLGSGYSLSLLCTAISDHPAVMSKLIGKLNSRKPQTEKDKLKLGRYAAWFAYSLTGLLIAFMVWQGLILWYARVYYYVLPPGSG